MVCSTTIFKVTRHFLFSSNSSYVVIFTSLDLVLGNSIIWLIGWFFWSSFCSGFGNPCYVSNWMHCLEEKDWSLFNHTSIFYKLVFSMKCSTETALVNLYLCHSVLTLFLFSLHNDVPLFFNIECICIKMCCVLIY